MKTQLPTVNVDSLPLFHIAPPEAMALLDSACALNDDVTDSAGMKRAYELVLEALKIDPEFGAARGLKPGFEEDCGMISREESSEKYWNEQMRSALFVASIGKMYDDKGDTLTANAYYRSVITRSNQILDTLTGYNALRDQMHISKVIALVCLGKNSEANSVANEQFICFDEKQYRKTTDKLKVATKEQIYAASVDGVWK